jgi:IPT/TIG domain
LGARIELRNAACAGSIGVSILAMNAFGPSAGLSQATALEVMSSAPLRAAAPPSVFAETARTQLRLYALSPQSGSAGTSVTLTGFGFTNDNAIHFGSVVTKHVLVRSTFGVSCTVAPSCRGGVRQLLVFKVPAAPPGKYRVFVENSNGESNQLSFSVN